MYMPTTLPGISIGKARQVLQQTDKLIQSFPEVKSVFGKMGRAETATDPAPLTMVESVVQLKPRSEWPAGMTPEKLKDKLNQAVNLPGITNAWVMPIKTRIDMLATGIKTPVGIKIMGPSLATIQKMGVQMESILNKVPGTSSVYADRAVGGRYINVDIDRHAAARFNLSVQAIQEVVQTAIGGINVTETIEGRERFPVNLRYPQTDRDSVEKIRMLPIVTPSGAHIPLADVAKIYVADGPPVIKSENARLTGWILVDLDTSDVGSYIKLAKDALQKDLKLEPGYSFVWSGQYEYMQRAKARLMMVGPLTLVIIILLLYLNFRHFGEVLVILSTLPLALTGGIWLLYLMNYNLSVAVGVGFIALSGLAVEIGVVMLVYLNQAWRATMAHAKEQGKTLNNDMLKQSIIDGALLRVRPIIMTVSATIIGLLTVMMGGGTGSEVMRRIAAPMVGGMVSATFLTLVVIPAVYYLWKRVGLEKLHNPKL